MELAIALLAAIGYAAIAIEDKLKVDKASLALLTAILCWGIYFVFTPLGMQEKFVYFNKNLSDITQVLFYLMGAMLLVEVIDVHQGFQYLASKFSFTSHYTAYATTLILTFFLSAILDNLTTILIIISFLKTVIPDRNSRLLYSASCVFAANAGGAWTPIGDITTTMLWIEGKITTTGILSTLFIPSVVALVGFGMLTFFGKRIGKRPSVFSTAKLHYKHLPEGALATLLIGLITLIFVPILKALIDMPPFMTVLLGVAILWIVTDRLHHREIARNKYRVFHSLGRIDFSCILFFLGVLLTVEAVAAAGLFGKLSTFLESTFSNQLIIVYLVGIFSAVVDNVPLVGAMMKLYTSPVDSPVWTFTAYCAGVGGSLLSIGSAPGIALMSLENVDFSWYARHFLLPTFLAYTLGAIFAYFL